MSTPEYEQLVKEMKRLRLGRPGLDPGLDAHAKREALNREEVMQPDTD